MATVQQPERSFYVALPSDSSVQYFPENTLSGFTTKLPKEVQLNGSWECGVSEVRYPLTFYNVVEPMIITKVGRAEHLEPTLRFSPGYYTTIDVVKRINTFISVERAQLSLDSHSGKINLKGGVYDLRMSSSLIAFLGHEFDQKILENGVFKREKIYNSLHTVASHRGFDTLFIYCDALAPRIVGDSNASLLITLPNANKRSLFGDVINNRITKIRYFPVAKRRFHTIRIDIKTDVATPVRFEGGKVYIELHFRKVKSA
jgi:hypothetical protein